MKAIQYIYIVASLCLASGLSAQSESVLHQLSLPATTKAMALGGVTTSVVASDGALALESPALFGREHHGQLSMSYLNLWGDKHQGSLFYGREFGERGAWGVGARYMGYGEIDARDRYGMSLGTLTARDLVLQGAYSYELTDYLRLGVSLKGIYSVLADYTAWGIGADLGLNYFSQSRERSLGISLVNIGTLLRPYVSERTEALPWDLRLGYSQRLSHAPFQIHLTAYGLRPRPKSEYTPEGLSSMERTLRHLAIGVEYVPNDKFWVGIGYNPRLAQNYRALRGAKLSGVSLGVGFNQAGYRAAVAVTAYDSSFWGIMATFSTDFGLINKL